jgi:hypothetical protein
MWRGISRKKVKTETLRLAHPITAVDLRALLADMGRAASGLEPAFDKLAAQTTTAAAHHGAMPIGFDQVGSSTTTR